MPNQYTKDKGLTLKEIHQAYYYYSFGKMSCKDVAIKFNVSRGSIFNYFQRLGLKTRPLKYKLKDSPFIEYKGMKYFKDSYGSYRASTKQRIPLHKAMWIDRHGPLKEKEIVSFLDGDKENLTLENFFLTTRIQLMDKAHKTKGKIHLP